MEKVVLFYGCAFVCVCFCYFRGIVTKCMLEGGARSLKDFPNTTFVNLPQNAIT